MPKIDGTRAQRAAELLARLQRGPVFSDIVPEDRAMTPERAAAQVRGWLESWIIPDVLALVPELRKAEADRRRREGADRLAERQARAR